MLHTSTRKLIDRLSEMTELGKLDWIESDDGNIAYSTEGYSVTLTESPNEVVITSKDGKELERASAEQIAATETEDGTSYTALVAAMTAEAARVARGTEAAISSLLAGMEDAPVEVSNTVEEDTAEPLQEDLGDDTAVLADETVSDETEDTAETEAETPAEDAVLVSSEATEDAEIETEESVQSDESSDTEDDIAPAAFGSETVGEAEAVAEAPGRGRN